MQLALTTGIPVVSWLAGDPRDIDTALAILVEQQERRDGP